MKLSDYFINGRYLFGFILPGTLWVATAALLISPTEFEQFGRHATVAQWAGLLLAGLLAGHAIGPYTFDFVKWSSRIFHRLPVLHLGPERERLDDQQSERLVQLKSRVKAIVQKRYADEAYYTKFNNNDLHLFCKRTVMEKTSKLGEKLTEFENEINLRAMFVLPLLAFAAVWSWNGRVAPPHWVCPVLMAVGAVVLWTRVYPVVCDEVRSIYEMFLIIEDTPEAK